MKYRPILGLVAPLCMVFTGCTWRDDTGYSRLIGTFTDVPAKVTDGVSEIEPADESGNHLPFDPSNITNSEFTGKTLTNKSPSFGTGISTAASQSAAIFYGNNSSPISGTTAIDVYNATDWLTGTANGASVGLGMGTNYAPAVENRRVQNHRWFATSGFVTAQIEQINARLDYAVNRDGFISVVDVKTASITEPQQLLSQSYNTISVGRSSDTQPTPLTTVDGPGRVKPELVAPQYNMSPTYSAAMVSSAAGLLAERLTSAPYSLGNAYLPQVTKSLLIAGATKEKFADWTRSNSQPLDRIHGAGELNFLLSYRILKSGSQAPSTSVAVQANGWSTASVTGGASQVYFFDVPAGSTATRLSAAVTWHRSIAADSPSPTLYSPTLTNLDLTLYSASGFTLGSAIDASTSTVDNVEHIYSPSLAPGRYALAVSAASGSPSTIYGLAWRTSPTVNITATTPVAREIDGSTAVFTVTRLGSTTTPLLVPLNWSGTALAGIHYTAPNSVLIPAGSATATVSVSPIADNLAQGNRTVTLTVVTDYSLSAGATASANVTIEDKPYDAWRFTQFTSSELADAAISGPTADPDADGLSNLVEYALGAAALTSDASLHAPVSAIVADHLVLTYTRPTAITDVTYLVEWSGDLQAWANDVSVIEAVSSTPDVNNDTTTVIVRSVATLSAAPRQFLRLRVSKP